MRVARNHQATLSGTRASSEGDMRGGAGECGVGHPEEGSARLMTSVLFRKVLGQGPRTALLRSGRCSGGREGQGALPPECRMPK